jgi:hypothetical protein
VNRARYYERKQPKPSGLFGGIYGIDILQVTSFAASIPWTVMSSIFIVRPRSSRSNWMVVGIIIVRAKFAIGRARNCWLVGESSDSPRTQQRFASDLVGVAGGAPKQTLYLNPLPLGKGEVSGKQNVLYKDDATSFGANDRLD